jgi:hypothetical protein
MKIGEELVHDNLITKEQLAKALEVQKKKPNMKIGEILLELGYIDVEKFMIVLDKQMRASGLQK